MRGLAPRALMAGALGLLVGLPPPVVYADGGDASLIHACVKKSNPRGQTRIVGPSVRCAAGERANHWSITGPAGSGKTTTLASMVNHMNHNRTDHIVTIEDPIEYELPGINQTAVQEKIGLTFGGMLRALLRQATGR